MVIYESVFFLSRESGLAGDYGKGSDKKKALLLLGRPATNFAQKYQYQ